MSAFRSISIQKDCLMASLEQSEVKNEARCGNISSRMATKSNVSYVWCDFSV